MIFYTNRFLHGRTSQDCKQRLSVSLRISDETAFLFGIAHMMDMTFQSACELKCTGAEQPDSSYLSEQPYFWFVEGPGGPRATVHVGWHSV